MTIACAAAALAIAIAVTHHAHSRGGFWAQRLGQTRFRRANLPVGGTILAIGALLAPSAAAMPLGAAAAAMAAAAIAWRYVDPLPPFAPAPTCDYRAGKQCCGDTPATELEGRGPLCAGHRAYVEEQREKRARQRP